MLIISKNNDYYGRNDSVEKYNSNYNDSTITIDTSVECS